MFEWKLQRVAGAGLVTLSVLFSACGGSSGGDSDDGVSGDQPLNPATQPNEVMKVLDMRVGNTDAELQTGNPPEKSGTAGDPSVAVADDALEVNSGGGLDIDVDFDSSSALAKLFVQVVGADSYAEIEFTQGSTKAVESLSLAVVVNTDIGSGQFCLDISGQNVDELVSNAERVCVTVDRTLLDALQGRWVADCLDGGSESFHVVWDVEHADVLSTETLYLGTSTCAGTADSTYNEELFLSVGGTTVASDGGEAYEVDIVNLSEGNASSLCIIRPEEEQFLIGCGDGTTRASELSEVFAREQAGSGGAKFTSEFLAGRVFYLEVIDEASGTDDSVAQWVFNADGSGSVYFLPSDDNDFDTDDVNPISWAVTNQGVLEYTEFGSDGEEYRVTVTASAVDSNSALFSCTVEEGGQTLFACAEDSSMTAADGTLYDFLAGRAFVPDIADGDIERLVFNQDGTGSIRFEPNPDNDFSNNDVNSIHWRAVSGNRLEFTEFGGDGHDRGQTNCENDQFIDCELAHYDFTFSFTEIGGSSATFNWELDYTEYNENGAVEETGSASGSGSMQVE